MATKRKAQVNEDNTVEVEWTQAPLDVTLEKHGNKKPDRKVKVRGILGDEWLEHEAGLGAGAVKKLMAAIEKALKHGYEARLNESVRFVHIIDADFTTMRVSVQPMGSFRDCLKDVAFTMRYNGEELNAEEAEGLREEGDEHTLHVSEVTPDPVLICELCGHPNRVGKRRG